MPDQKELPPIVVIGVLAVFVILIVVGLVYVLTPHEKVVATTGTIQGLEEAQQKLAAQWRQSHGGGQSPNAPADAATP